MLRACAARQKGEKRGALPEKSAPLRCGRPVLSRFPPQQLYSSREPRRKNWPGSGRLRGSIWGLHPPIARAPVTVALTASRQIARLLLAEPVQAKRFFERSCGAVAAQARRYPGTQHDSRGWIGRASWRVAARPLAGKAEQEVGLP